VFVPHISSGPSYILNAGGTSLCAPTSWTATCEKIGNKCPNATACTIWQDVINGCFLHGKSSNNLSLQNPLGPWKRPSNPEWQWYSAPQEDQLYCIVPGRNMAMPRTSNQETRLCLLAMDDRMSTSAPSSLWQSTPLAVQHYHPIMCHSIQAPSPRPE
jgi:hypothetical protein